MVLMDADGVGYCTAPHPTTAVLIEKSIQEQKWLCFLLSVGQNVCCWIVQLVAFQRVYAHTLRRYEDNNDNSYFDDDINNNNNNNNEDHQTESVSSNNNHNNKNDGCNSINPDGKTRAPLPVAESGTERKTINNTNFALPSRDLFRAQFEAIDFKFDLLAKVKTTPMTPAGRGALLTVADMPALFGEGMGFSYFQLAPCSLILPHVHPRASGGVLMISGKIQFGFIDDASRLVLNELSTGQVAIVPMGLVHFAANAECTNATYFGIYGHEDPGLYFPSVALFDSPPEVLAATLNVDEHLANKLRNGIPDVIPVQLRESCLKKCGRSKWEEHAGNH